MTGFKWTGRRLALAVIVVALILGTVAYRISARHGMDLYRQTGQIGGPFRLTSVSEGSVTEGDYRGRWVLMWFFDTHCPKTLCGPTLTAMSDASKTLKGEHISLAPLAVTLDPLHDQADQLKSYVLPIAPRDEPLMAAPTMVERVAREFHAPMTMVKPDDGQAYHQPAPRIVILSPAGRYAGTIESSATAADIVARIKDLSKD